MSASTLDWKLEVGSCPAKNAGSPLRSEKAEGGVPEEQVFEFEGPDLSWEAEWKEFAAAVREQREPLASQDPANIVRVDLPAADGGGDPYAAAARLLADGKLERRALSLAQRALLLPPLCLLALRAAREQVRKRTRGLYPAPMAILDCVQTGLLRGLDQGLECESLAFGRLAAGSESRALVRLFLAMNETKKMPPGAQPRPIRRAAVLGAGFMGAGIATVFVLRHVLAVLP